jgi:hypothetical protein
MYVHKHNKYFFALMTTSFGHYGHHQANIVQKFEKKNTVLGFQYGVVCNLIIFMILFMPLNRPDSAHLQRSSSRLIIQNHHPIRRYASNGVHQDRKRTYVTCSAFAYPSLPRTRNNTFPLYCCWRICGCQQYKSTQCCQGNNNKFPVHCCRATKYFVLLLTVISITHSECVSVALVIQHAKRIRRTILSSVACPAVPYISILSHKRHDCQG